LTENFAPQFSTTKVGSQLNREGLILKTQMKKKVNLWKTRLNMLNPSRKT
jgi:hypothetical protein